ncbi:centromere protein T isoform X2 [Heterocephalus glaber]|uniref:Centromere protein T n=1 Tax=Heterocephalus glaber TaxID=10181 RepID=A0AAX6SSZ8_HETGA|nr:centromere protein T isoform X2 [Heterocephalus glaber]
MANIYSSDCESTTRTLLRHVLDTADSCTPRRRRSARISAQRALLETPSPKRWSSQTKTTARERSHGARSTGRLARGQAGGHLEEQTPRTLLKNILLTAPESSIVMPERVVKPAPAPQVAQPSRQESSRGSLELQLPELEPPPALAPVLLASGRRKQRLRLSVFQQQVDRGPQRLPLSQEPPGNPDASSLTSSLSLTFATPLQPESVRRPGLARRPPTRRAVDMGALLQDLQDNSLASVPLGDSLRTPVATQPTDTVLEDTQPFSQPLVGHSLNVHHSLPCPYPGPEGTEKAVRHRTQSSMPGLQNHMSEAGFATPSLPFLELQPGPPAPSEVTKAKRSQRALEPEDPEGSSGDEDISDRPASPESVSNVPEFLQAKQLDQFLEPAPSPDVAVLDKYLEHLCNDLEVFAAHAGRKTVKPEDLELLMRRQGLITDQVSLHVLVERHLPLEYRQLLIPCAFSGNSVFPAQ